MAEADIRIVIIYNNKTDKFTVESNAKDTGDIVEQWIRGQLGKGVDESKPNIQDVYTIEICVDLSEDIFTVKDDCGNKGLREGILAHFLKNYEKAQMEIKANIEKG